MHPYRSLMASILALSLASPLYALAQSLALPDIGDFSRQYLSTSDEHRLGAAVLNRLRDQGVIIEDVQLNEYLNSIGQRIAAYAEYSGNPLTFFLVKDPNINAFAAPGGYIGVNSGLILATQSEDELAGVIAHETAHVSQRHIARSFADAQRLSIPMAAAIIASVLVAAASPDAGQAALAGTLAAGVQHQINFTRANEQEADRIGTQLLSQAGFDPNGMAKFFMRLERIPGTAAQTQEFLRTHPLPSSRIADVQDRFNNTPTLQTQSDSAAYYLAKVRLLVLTHDDINALIHQFEITLAQGNYRNESAERYGYALALKRGGRYNEANQQIMRLRRSDPDNLAFRIEEAEIALAKGERERAWRLFENTYALYPNDFTLAMHYGQALAIQGNPHKAMQLLQPQLHHSNNNLSLYSIYAQAAQRAGDIATTHATLAEYYYLNGELPEAIEQTEMALNHPGITSYQQAQLRAKLRQLKEEKARQKENPLQ